MSSGFSNEAGDNLERGVHLGWPGQKPGKSE